MKFEELGGRIHVDPAQAASLIRTLFDPQDILTISGKRVTRREGVNVYTQAMTAQELVSDLYSPEAEQLVYDLCTDPEPSDIYFGLSPIRPGSFRGHNKRVKIEDVDHVSVIYADLDVKPGSFTSQQDAIDFLKSLPFFPNAVVSSGSGGLHAYWRVQGFAGSQVNVQVGKDLYLHWWAYLSDTATGRNIDRLIDVTRMSRLAGTIRWPKPGVDGEVPQPVELLYANRASSIDALELLRVSEDAWVRLQHKRAEVRRKDESLAVNAEKLAVNLSGGRWSTMLAVSQIEDWIAENLPWENILTPAGWTYLREDDVGRREWARPGRNEKSATVDWPDSPHVMSLLSTSIETQLADLQDAGIPLTKWRVLLRLNFADNVESAVKWTLEQMKRLGG